MEFDTAFLKDRYDFELNRKDALTASLTLPVGVLTGIGGLLTAMTRSFSYSTPRLAWFFLFVIAADVAVFCACMVLLGRAYHAQTYVYLPLLQELDTASYEFREFNSYVARTGGDVEETFEQNLRTRIIQAADANTLSNDRRSKWLHYSRIALFWVLGLTALSVIPYVIDQVQNRHSNVTQQHDGDGSAGRAGADTPPSPGAQSQRPQAAPERPTFPANRIIREGREPGTEKRGNDKGGKK